MTADEKSNEIKRLKDYAEKLSKDKELLAKKLKIATTALMDIKQWEEDWEEIWEDTGARASEALNKIEKL